MDSRKFRSLLSKSKYGDENFSDSLSILSFDEESRKLDRFLEKQKVGLQVDNKHMKECEVNENPPMHRKFQIHTISLTLVLLDKTSNAIATWFGTENKRSPTHEHSNRHAH